MAPSCSPTESFELIVVGGAHAGCEAALTAPVVGEARLSPHGDGADHCGTFRAVARRSGQAPRLDRDRRPMALDHGADLQ
jgi:hypothetical protein